MAGFELALAFGIFIILLNIMSFYNKKRMVEQVTSRIQAVTKDSAQANAPKKDNVANTFERFIAHRNWLKKQEKVLFYGVPAAIYVSGWLSNAGTMKILRVIVIYIIAYFLVTSLISFFIDYQRRKATKDLPVIISILNRTLMTGMAPHRAVREVSSHFKGPLATELTKLSLWLTLSQIGEVERTKLLADEDTQFKEIKFLEIVFMVHQRTGGNLIAILENLAQLVRDQQNLEADIKALLTEPKATAVVMTLVPILSFIGLWVQGFDSINFFFEHPVGQMMLMASVFFILIGVIGIMYLFSKVGKD